MVEFGILDSQHVSHICRDCQTLKFAVGLNKLLLAGQNMVGLWLLGPGSLYHLQAVQPWASYLNFLNVSSLPAKSRSEENNRLCDRAVLKIKGEAMTECLALCQAQKRPTGGQFVITVSLWGMVLSMAPGIR